MINRRQFVGFAGVGAACISFPRIAFASVESASRFIFIIQRGAADGLDTLVPIGDPDYVGLRGTLTISNGVKLNSEFALHPSLAEVAKMYRDGEALFVHAIASAYRDRSHFDGQNVLETGGMQPYQVKDGWLNRLVQSLPKGEDRAIAFTTRIPMALRGSARVETFAPSQQPETSRTLLEQVEQLYMADDELHSLWATAMSTRELAGAAPSRQTTRSIGKLAGQFLSSDHGPRIAMIETDGWDTHVKQSLRLANQLSELDLLIASLREGLGSAWAKTTILVATEFGRTAKPNGSGGTDHGTASVAMLAGGAVNGGRVVADWPGLSMPGLHEGRDLRPTAAVEDLIAAVASQSFGIDPSRLFDRRTGAKKFDGLLA